MSTMVKVVSRPTELWAAHATYYFDWTGDEPTVWMTMGSRFPEKATVVARSAAGLTELHQVAKDLLSVNLNVGRDRKAVTRSSVTSAGIEITMTAESVLEEYEHSAPRHVVHRHLTIGLAGGPEIVSLPKDESIKFSKHMARALDYLAGKVEVSRRKDRLDPFDVLVPKKDDNDSTRRNYPTRTTRKARR